jgi:cytochrome c556
MNASTLPLPPAIAQQQQAPLHQFVQQAGAGSPMAGAQGAVAAAPSDQLIQQILDRVGKDLESVAKIVVNEKPYLVPLLKPVVQGLAAFSNELQTGQGSQPTANGGPPDGGNQGTAQEGSPNAAGGASMGMGAQ